MCVSLFLILINLAKPNFILIFAPVLLIFLLLVFFKGKKNIVSCLLIGTCVLILLFVLIFQYKIMFISADEETGIILSLENAISYILVDKKFALHFFLPFAFPIACFFIFIFDAKLNKNEHIIYVFSFLCLIFGVFEYLFFTETGKRVNDGNFGWGGIFFSFILTIVSMSLIIKKNNNKKISKSNYCLAKYTYYLHFVSGLAYYFLIIINYTASWRF